MDERYFIFRINGSDAVITTDPERAEMLLAFSKSERMLKEERTEYNKLTTTYNFSVKL